MAVERKEIIDLCHDFKLDNPGLKTEGIMGLIDSTIDPDTFDSVEKWAAQCHNPPWHDEKVMCALDEILETFGVETVDLPGDSGHFTYCNSGDTYSGTIVCHDGEYYVSTWGDFFEEKEAEAIEDIDEKSRALASHLEVCPFSVTECADEYSSTDASGEYSVLTDEEADEAWDESLDNYLDECVLDEIPEKLRPYFDCDSWKSDAKMDGRGHSLSSYDGNEYDVEIDGTTYYIYRTN